VLSSCSRAADTHPFHPPPTLSTKQVNEECSDRVLAIEQECAGKRRPLYVTRAAALSKIPRFWKMVSLTD
jgi:hypothetical protein